MPVSALPKSTNLLTTASAVVASCVSKRAQDPASSVETLYVRPLNPHIPIFSIHFLFMRVVFSFFSWIQVCTREEQEILQRDSNKSQKLRKKLMGGESQNESKLVNVIIMMMVDAMNSVLFC